MNTHAHIHKYFIFLYLFISVIKLISEKLHRKKTLNQANLIFNKNKIGNI
jgi:hypothetical protein